MKRIFLVFCGILSLAACAPQAELVKTRSELSDLRQDLKTTQARLHELQKREADLGSRMETVNTNMIGGSSDLQKALADYGAKTDQMSTDIQLLQGRLEENNFRIADLAQKVDDKTFKIAELSTRLDDLEQRLKNVSAQGMSSGPTPTAEKKSVPKSLEPSEVYRQAMNDYNNASYDLALAGFQNYLGQFPDSSQADKAQYWIGESLYAKKDFQNAIEAFSKVIKNYPKSDKAAGAKLKIGYSYLNLRNETKAKEWLKRVVKEYPDTHEAELAKEKLHKIGK